MFPESPFNFLIFRNRANVKNPKGSLFQNFRHYETVRKKTKNEIFEKIFKDFLLIFFQKFSLKTPRVPSFTVYGIVTFYKRNNFSVKIRFSQVRHAISDFCCFKRPVFFSATFLKICLFHRSPSSIFARNETFCES